MFFGLQIDETTMTTFTILLVEDNPGDARLIEELLSETETAGVRLQPPDTSRSDESGIDADPVEVGILHTESLARGIERLNDDVDVVLLDLNLPDSSGIETLEAILETPHEVPVVVLTGVPEERLGRTAVAKGAQDYLPKADVTGEVLVRTMEYAVARHASEQELHRRTEQLAVLNRLMRHDIRNDISLVVGRSKELADHVDHHGATLVSEILTAGNHVLQLTRSVGDAAETVTSIEPLPLVAVDLSEVISSEVETARDLYEDATVEVVGDLPPVEVQANRLLSSVFGNLISNALLYNDAEVPLVRIEATVEDETATVRVADNGPGIPPERREVIFQRGTSGDGGGTGTGLYLVDQLVERYGGKVDIEDTPDGTAFTVTLSRV